MRGRTMRRHGHVRPDHRSTARRRQAARHDARPMGDAVENLLQAPTGSCGPQGAPGTFKGFRLASDMVLIRTLRNSGRQSQWGAPVLVAALFVAHAASATPDAAGRLAHRVVPVFGALDLSWHGWVLIA